MINQDRRQGGIQAVLNKNTDQFIFEKPFHDFFHFFRILSLLLIALFRVDIILCMEVGTGSTDE